MKTDTRKTNTAKYESYRLAFCAIKLAIEKGFPIEAIALEESIISDRLQSAAEGKGLVVGSARRGRTADFSTLVKQVESQPEFESLRDYLNNKGLPVSALDTWRLERNDFIHNVVHGFPGKAPAIAASEFSKKGKDVATRGLKFARTICAWSKRELSRIRRNQ